MFPCLEFTVEMLVLRLRWEIVEGVGLGPQERARRRITEQIEAVPAPLNWEGIVEAARSMPHERTSHRVREHIVEGPVPQVARAVFRTLRSCAISSVVLCGHEAAETAAARGCSCSGYEGGSWRLVEMRGHRLEAELKRCVSVKDKVLHVYAPWMPRDRVKVLQRIHRRGDSARACGPHQRPNIGADCEHSRASDRGTSQEMCRSHHTSA